MAATEIGRQDAGLSVPPLPDRCRDKMGRVTPQTGEKWRSVHWRWTIVADAEDRRVSDCVKFYDDLKAGLAMVPSQK